MRDYKEAVGVACQIVYEYANWGDEHVYDMLMTYAGDERPCSYDELVDLCWQVAKCRRDGLSYSETEAHMSEEGE